MNKNLIYLIGFPGSGKFTVAKELCKIIDAVIVQNNMFNDIIFNIVNLKGNNVPDNLWNSIFKVRENLLAILGKYHSKSKHYIFTNELIEGDCYDRKIYDSVVNLSNSMQVKMLPVVLHCSDIGELMKRIQFEERRQYNKITNLYYAMERTREKKLFIPPNALEIDNSNLSAEKVAKRIIEEMEKMSKN
ncbi:MAG: hypothetical protein QWI36_01305 [Wolbachia endosymbiont of Tyrophagus putrescentiae]|nr:hypothetical protein [Wolbachia endosymbiont of Tyrophagus putrescentiae]